MPTLFTHPVIPLAITLGFGRDVIPTRLLIAGILFSILPDLDVIGLKLGIPYAAEYGHRGLTHSLLFAFCLALAATLFYRWLDATFHATFWFVFTVIASHPLLDAFTNGGLGEALLWPWSDYRYFAPVTLIEVSPISPTRFLSLRGWEVFMSELQWVWLPCLSVAMAFAITRHISEKLDIIRFK